MAKNFHIKSGVRSEQLLYENLVIESLKIYGQEVYYLPRDIVNENKIFGDDVPSRFNSSYKIEMFIENVEGFEGEGDLFTKFGVEIRDEATFIVSRRRWGDTVGRYDNEISGERPREGDLIFFPWVRGSIENEIGALFEVKYVENESVFYQLGNLQTYDISLEKFEYSNERFSTGIAVIDAIETTLSQDKQLTTLHVTTEAGSTLTTESGEDIFNDSFSKRTTDKADTSDFFEDTADGFIDFSEINPFSENDF